MSDTTAGFDSSASIFWQPHDAVFLSVLSVHVAMLHSALFTGQYTIGEPPFAVMFVMKSYATCVSLYLRLVAKSSA